MLKDPPPKRAARLRPGLRKLRRVLSRTAEPLELELLGRILLHSVLIGAAAGLVGSLFYYLLELTERLVLEGLAGYEALRAGGEEIHSPLERAPFRPSTLWLLPALGALLGGLLTRFAPEARGGGADAIISDFHHHRGEVRRRVPLIKALASILTLGFGGSGGREGPTMHIGGALGSLVGRALGVDERERRILLVAGLAAGVSAVFRTPLGAALLAVEVLHRDDFESDALVPSVLASVTSYSVFISFFGEATLFTHAPRYPFVLGHLPLYALMALVISLGAIGFLGTIRVSRHVFSRLPVPEWLRPACGGLALGTLVVPILIELGPRLGGQGRGIGLLGGGYGAAQLAITGAPWLPGGWYAVQLLALLAVLKAVATALTLGSGGSAGDFGPSLVVGGLIGGAFGRAAQLLLDDPRIDPGAFALVGMGTFYGGLAHVPIASLVLVCELAGSYDLLVPLMLAEAIAFIGLRRYSLYSSQVRTKRESPAHRDDMVFDVLREVKVGDALVRHRPYVSFRREASARQILDRSREAGAWQDVFPVLAEDGKLLGAIDVDRIRDLAIHPDLLELTLALDVMAAPVSVTEDDDLHTALERMLAHGTREIVVLDAAGAISGFLDESEVQSAYHQATIRQRRSTV